MCNGFSPDGLPLGMQVVGAPFEEATVLRVARAYEQATPWRERRPSPEPGDAPPPRAEPPRFPPLSELAPAAVARCREAARLHGLDLDDAQLAGLCHALPHLERIRARLPRERNHGDLPSTVFRHDGA